MTTSQIALGQYPTSIPIRLCLVKDRSVGLRVRVAQKLAAGHPCSLLDGAQQHHSEVATSHITRVEEGKATRAGAGPSCTIRFVSRHLHLY